jgi:hypothetical protein
MYRLATCGNLEWLQGSPKRDIAVAPECVGRSRYRVLRLGRFRSRPGPPSRSRGGRSADAATGVGRSRVPRGFPAAGQGSAPCVGGAPAARMFSRSRAVRAGLRGLPVCAVCAPRSPATGGRASLGGGRRRDWFGDKRTLLQAVVEGCGPSSALTAPGPDSGRQRDGAARQSSLQTRRRPQALAPSSPVRRGQRIHRCARSAAVQASAVAPSAMARSAASPTQWSANSFWWLRTGKQPSPT